MNKHYQTARGRTKFNLKTYLNKRAAQVNRALADSLPINRTSPRIQRAMHHSLMAGGKRLRPILCMAAAEAVGGEASQVVPAACALEMIHTYSLIHDDLPAMDNDALRRGKPTCHIAFDEATAIMAGDALLTMAFQILTEAPMTQITAESRITAINIISNAAGYRGMIAGQMQDMSMENKPARARDLESLHRLKTGALIRASVQTGAVLCRASSRQLNQLAAYADHIGLAFQIKDDILNVEGTPERMGKAVGTDTLRKKVTYPTLFGLEKSRSLAQKQVTSSLRSLEGFDNKADPLRSISMYILNRNR